MGQMIKHIIAWICTYMQRYSYICAYIGDHYTYVFIHMCVWHIFIFLDWWSLTIRHFGLNYQQCIELSMRVVWIVMATCCLLRFYTIDVVKVLCLSHVLFIVITIIWLGLPVILMIYPWYMGSLNVKNMPRTWSLGHCTRTALGSLGAPGIVIMTTSGASGGRDSCLSIQILSNQYKLRWCIFLSIYDVHRNTHSSPRVVMVMTSASLLAPGVVAGCSGRFRL